MAERFGPRRPASSPDRPVRLEPEDASHGSPHTSSAGTFTSCGFSLAYTDATSDQIFVSRAGCEPTPVTNEPPDSHVRVVGWSGNSTRLCYSADTL